MGFTKENYTKYYIKAQKVIESCKTKEQLIYATQYINLMKKYLPSELYLRLKSQTFWVARNLIGGEI
jgi:hypothetical protein